MDLIVKELKCKAWARSLFIESVFNTFSGKKKIETYSCQCFKLVQKVKQANIRDTLLNILTWFIY